MVVAHYIASFAEIQAAVGTTVTQPTVRNQLLQGCLRARRPVARIPLTPCHCCRFCLGASDGRVLVRRRPGERLQPSCLRPRHTELIPGVIDWREIFFLAGALS
ncbi:allene oxide synthase-lipoxygenase protein [Trichonephila clavipes]|nr:allene oxide synthase-lipoxygenase protein [Trichonephila clavipes]